MAKHGNSRKVFVFPRSPFYSVSIAALTYVPSERIIKLSQPNNKFISGIFFFFFKLRAFISMIVLIEINGMYNLFCKQNQRNKFDT
jgi:hypothetical protein